MRTFDRIPSLRTYLRGIRQEGRSVGLVPTMGALHAGHVALVRRAKAECDAVVVSLFVNPTQFGPHEDFAAYPRDLSADQRLLAEEGVWALFAPAAEEVYPPGARTIVEVEGLSSTLEGACRPGHFRGVATVVSKLLTIVQPDAAFFGQKDYQQLLVIERMTRDLHFPLEIVPVATVREPDGLAMSSRNAYLSQSERQAATALYRALKLAQTRIVEGARDAETRNASSLRAELEEEIRREPLAQIDYVAVADPENLQPLADLPQSPVLVALAVRIGKTRLIDNALIGLDGAWLTRARTRMS
jgi:pantoate--beta-alanine ligase